MGKRRRIRSITTEVEVDIDLDLVTNYIYSMDDVDDLQEIIGLATEQLGDAAAASASQVLTYHNPTVMDELAMRDLQAILNTRGPEWMLDMLKQH